MSAMLRITEIRKRVRMTVAEVADKYLSRGLDERGRAELPDPKPMAPPVGYRKAPHIRDLVREMVVAEHLRREFEAKGLETFEEADDFDIEDDPAPVSRFDIVESDLDPILPSPQPPEAAEGAAAGSSPKADPAPPPAPPEAPKAAPGGPKE